MVSTRIQLRRDLAATWTSVNPTLAAGEAGYETDTLNFKLGDGVAAWNDLPYAGGGGGARDMYLDARDYGVVADGVPSAGTGTDNYVALAAALADAGTFNRYLFLPTGNYGVTQQLVIPNKVKLLGEGRSNTLIFALPGFSGLDAGSGVYSPDSAVIRLGTKDDNAVFGTILESCTIQGGNLDGVGGVYMASAQEQTGLRYVSVSRWTKYGVMVENTPSGYYGTTDNSRSINSTPIFECEILGQGLGVTPSFAADAVGLHIRQNPTHLGKGPSNVAFHGLTLNGTGMPTCCLIDGADVVLMSRLHMEDGAIGLQVGGDKPVTSFSLLSGKGHSSLGTMVKILNPDTQCYSFTDIDAAGALMTIDDTLEGIQLFDRVGMYSVGSGIPGSRPMLSTTPDVASRFDLGAPVSSIKLTGKARYDPALHILWVQDVDGWKGVELV